MVFWIITIIVFLLVILASILMTHPACCREVIISGDRKKVSDLARSYVMPRIMTSGSHAEAMIYVPPADIDRLKSVCSELGISMKELD